MSKFLPEKKKLLEEVFEKASRETPETSFSGILLHLEQVLKDDFEALSYKTFENYYKALVENDEDYKIKTPILDNLSRYLGFENFNDYCSGWKSFEYRIHQAMSKLVITVINKPIFKMPEITRQSGLGIVGLLLIGAYFWSGEKLSGEKNEPPKIQSQSQAQVPANEESKTVVLGIADVKPQQIPQHLPKAVQPTVKKKECMYWDGRAYKAAFCAENNPQYDMIAIDPFKLKYLKKITRPDTLTKENAIGKVWYDKSNNNVEFFTSYGKHPENGKALKDVTVRILKNYAGNLSQ